LSQPHDQATSCYARGELAPVEFKAAEDRAVREVVALQEELGLPVVNDGEMRRESFQSELAAACDGFTGVDLNAWLWGEWHSSEVGDATIARPAELAVVAPLRKRRNLAAEEFTFVRGCTGAQAKVTLPSPSLFANLWSPQRSTGAYPTLDAFLADVVQVLCEEVAELVRLGCTYIQLDAPHYPLLIDPGWRAYVRPAADRSTAPTLASRRGQVGSLGSAGRRWRAEAGSGRCPMRTGASGVWL
jgi:5-methyltetrahydropteroyltriglutamate--homocysteine methyltransferase